MNSDTSRFGPNDQPSRNPGLTSARAISNLSRYNIYSFNPFFFFTGHYGASGANSTVEIVCQGYSKDDFDRVEHSPALPSPPQHDAFPLLTVHCRSFPDLRCPWIGRREGGHGILRLGRDGSKIYLNKSIDCWCPE